MNQAELSRVQNNKQQKEAIFFFQVCLCIQKEEINETKRQRKALWYIKIHGGEKH